MDYPPKEPAGYIRWELNTDSFAVESIGVCLAILLVYLVGVVVGNFIGCQFWRIGEMVVLKFRWCGRSTGGEAGDGFISG